jgi:hypothetical protein
MSAEKDCGVVLLADGRGGRGLLGTGGMGGWRRIMSSDCGLVSTLEEDEREVRLKGGRGELVLVGESVLMMGMIVVEIREENVGVGDGGERVGRDGDGNALRCGGILYGEAFGRRDGRELSVE